MGFAWHVAKVGLHGPGKGGQNLSPLRPAITAFPGEFRKLYTFSQPCGGPPGEEPRITAGFRRKLDIWHAMIRMCACQDFLHFLGVFWADSGGHVRKYLIWRDFCIFDPKFLDQKILHFGFEPDRGAY